MVLQVLFVPHDDDRDGRRLPAATDLLQLLLDHIKAATIADAVDQDYPVHPLQLFVPEGTGLETKQHGFINPTLF